MHSIRNAVWQRGNIYFMLFLLCTTVLRCPVMSISFPCTFVRNGWSSWKDNTFKPTVLNFSLYVQSAQIYSEKENAGFMILLTFRTFFSLWHSKYWRRNALNCVDPFSTHFDARSLFACVNCSWLGYQSNYAEIYISLNSHIFLLNFGSVVTFNGWWFHERVRNRDLEKGANWLRIKW